MGTAKSSISNLGSFKRSSKAHTHAHHLGHTGAVLRRGFILPSTRSVNP